uniref:helix-turn-helix domain-containing protein n=1 Tax=Novosphingobium aquimarinum TaxID=2682494 RepID=UPI0012EB3A65
MLKTIEETCRILRCSRTTVYKLINQGKLVRVKVLPGVARITHDSIKALLAASVA